MKTRKLTFLGFEDYAVTDDGRVWSIRRKKWLKPGIIGHGYLKVILCKGGKRKNFLVHRLVALAFLENPENLPEVNHKDENKKNNNASNLEFCTSKDNNNYGTRNERISKKVSKKVFCKELNKIFNSVKEASNELGLLATGISNCLAGRRKTTGGYHFEFYIER